ncbi:MAG: UPF0104 family protein [Hyphomicrobiales bacterium]|nr:MAG: UPF0104 family protein [Hyphomicrobiales bacterium]
MKWFLVCTASLSAGFAIWLLTEIDWVHTAEALHSLDIAVIAQALGLTALSYCGLAAYDVIAVSSVTTLNISSRLAAGTSATAFGISNFLGFPMVTGTAVRVRMYAAGRDKLGPLLSVVGSGWLAFWLVSLAMAGAILVWRPETFIWSDHTTVVRIGGFCLCLCVVASLVWIGDGRSVTWRRTPLEFLSRQLTLWQMLAAVVDIVASGLVLYLFLPVDLAGDLAGFLAIFVVAVGLGILSHIPGGLGSFEATIMFGLGGLGRTDLATALLLYRLFRTVLPFVAAALVLVATGQLRNRRRAVQP